MGPALNRPESGSAMMDERRALVAELHLTHSEATTPEGATWGICYLCQTPWPCPAVRAADVLDPPDCKHERWVVSVDLIDTNSRPQSWIVSGLAFPVCLDCGLPASAVTP